ncbi:MAG: AAA family ATPase [Thaumarchaeota archaeon]|nr:AAA family ATPase [Candidatus Calditenuaceae archaeon]MDW8042126.1 AAA family ATPase [Nitrososphaerota archaeon]
MVKVHGPLEETKTVLRRVHIREVVLENFMSHEYSRVKISRGINLITGPNGAGKSSILLGISVALGQSYTERGERLADLIRRGQDSARISVVLDNSPIEGERPVRSIPLDTITITRYIKRTGEYWHYVNNRFRTKAEVDQLLRSLGINPNNLLIVMHQNMIEEFAARDDSEKLRMLEDAVGLSSMRERILQAAAKLSSLMGEVNTVRKALEEAGASVEYWKAEVERLTRKRELESRRESLELEYLYSLARTTELALKRKTELLERVRSELSSLRDEGAEVSEQLTSRRAALVNLLRGGPLDVDAVMKEVDVLIELASRKGVIAYRSDELERERRELEKEIRALERELEERIRIASERGPRVETSREPSEVQEELRFVTLQLSSIGTVIQEAEEMYFMADSKFRGIQIKAEELEQNVKKALEEVEHRKRIWREKLEELIGEVSPVYDEILSSVGGAGTIRLRGLEDPSTARLELYVGFRGNPATLLDARTHSGGERVLATLGFLLAVQSRVKSPFRAVDEFDVHLDPLNRERMMTMLLETARRHGDVQYLIITPGRVPEMDGINVILVQNVSGRSIVTGRSP